MNVALSSMIDAMKKATGFDYKYKIVGRRSVVFFLFLLLLLSNN